FLILQLPKARKLAVVDLAEARVIRRLDMPADEVVFAAGLDRLVLGLPTQRLLQRYNLSTLKKEQTVALPDDGEVAALRMGCNARSRRATVLQSCDRRDASGPPTSSWWRRTFSRERCCCRARIRGSSWPCVTRRPRRPKCRCVQSPTAGPCSRSAGSKP